MEYPRHRKPTIVPVGCPTNRRGSPLGHSTQRFVRDSRRASHSASASSPQPADALGATLTTHPLRAAALVANSARRDLSIRRQREADVARGR
jgi:hypothetical protein